jgi:hypothetical protein
MQHAWVVAARLDLTKLRFVPGVPPTELEPALERADALANISTHSEPVGKAQMQAGRSCQLPLRLN